MPSFASRMTARGWPPGPIFIRGYATAVAALWSVSK